MAREIFFNKEARGLLLEGVNIAGDAIGSTLGAAGKVVVIDPGYTNMPITTKDGVTVASTLSIKDPIKNAGIKMIRGASEATVKDAGDGTTTSAVLAQSIINAGLEAVNGGANPQEVKSGIEKAVKIIVENLKNISIPVTDNDLIKSIATISANNDAEIGEKLADAYAKIGNNGYLTIEPSKTSKTFVTIMEGAEMTRGWSNDKFVNTNKMTVEYENPKILILNYDIKTFKELEPFLKVYNTLHNIKEEPLVIIAKSFDGEPYNTFVVNKAQYGLKVCLIEAPNMYQKEALIDIATLTGAILITDDSGLKPEHARLEHLGSCSKIVVSRFSTLIMDGKGNKLDVDHLKESIKAEIAEAKEDEVKEVFEKRLARLSGSIGVIHVGGLTHVEQTERMHRVDDANRAVKSAIEEGIVAGGGIALIRSQEGLYGIIDPLSKDENIGIKIIKDACFSPLKKMIQNAGVYKTRKSLLIKIWNVIFGENNLIVEKLKFGGINDGYNVKTGKFVDMIEAKIIDPTKVVRCALENAASVACQVIISDVLIVEMGENN